MNEKSKLCPRCKFALSDRLDVLFCPNCGFDLSSVSKPTTKNDLSRPLNGCLYLLIGLIGAIILAIIPYFLVFGAQASGFFSDSGLIFVGALSAILLLALYPSIWFFGAKGKYGKVEFFGFVNLLVLTFIPIVGGWIASYYFGKGLYMAITHQSFPARDASKWGFVLGMLGVVLAVSLGIVSNQPNISTPIPTSNVTATQINYFYPTSTYAPTIQPTSDPCLYWSQVTTAMNSMNLCVKGLVTSLSQSQNAASRYKFSNKPNTFFIYSTHFEYYDPVTGKTLAPGTCIYITGTIQVIQSVPYMDMDASHVQFNSNPAACQ